MNKWIRVAPMRMVKSLKKVASVSRQLSYNVPSKAISKVGSFICPSCKLEVKIKDLIERNGNIGCINCLK